MDLRNRDLPKTVVVDGRSYDILTDYRVWLNFGERIKDDKCTLRDLLFVFKDSDKGVYPRSDFLPELLEFYQNPNATPKVSSSGSDDRLYDYILDGEYIWASFVQAYGIDLYDVEMHWHRFKALFAGLPDNTKMSQIMSYRGYKRASKSDNYDKTMQKMKRAWALPVQLTAEEQAILDEVNNL